MRNAFAFGMNMLRGTVVVQVIFARLGDPRTGGGATRRRHDVCREVVVQPSSLVQQIVQ